jgi:hypothetical protein
MAAHRERTVFSAMAELGRGYLAQVGNRFFF